MKIKVTQVGSNSLVGSYVSERIKRGDNNYLDIREDIEFYIDKIVPKVDLVLEIDTFRKVYPESPIKIFDIKSYEE